ncbi:MAG: regulatory iron-sulfur-containing complex subunit RicT [Planctomycetaceae bacterium]|nr:regulatory iron-sulfur-containing complex subunit RicT [Planctomycetaceae bacterium]
MSEQEVEAPPTESAAPPSLAEPYRAFVARYGIMRSLGDFTAKASQDLWRGAAVIVRTPRGIEWGEILSPASDRTRNYLGLTDEPGRIMRLATVDDGLQRDALADREREEFRIARELIAERHLGMQLVDVEHLFGGDRIVFYYVAEDRVDFRELVKALAKELKVRIEMRQIGIRDEAKLLADYGDCGQPVCCNTHLREMPPVSMKMAKLQKATLDPNKISGRCGRLKCCLRYEYDTYEAHRKELPPVGSTVITKQGTGKVIGQELLAKKLVVIYDGQRQVLTDFRDVVTVIKNNKATGSSA